MQIYAKGLNVFLT